MKRSRLDEPAAKEGGGGGSSTTTPNNNCSSGTLGAATPSLFRTTSAIAYMNSAIGGGVKVGVGDMFGHSTAVAYGSMPTAATAPHSGGKPQAMQQQQQQQVPPRSKGSSPPTAVAGQQLQQSPGSSSSSSGSNNFQRLKVEDALSYLDLVKYKFGSQPQVYNDFLDIMKEFKSQSIDTPGVIQRVSNLFRGFPDLIVGFNTFLPPGYKIEVQRSEQGYAFQVSVSMPSPTGNLAPADPQQQKPAMILSGSGTIIHNNLPAPQGQQSQLVSQQQQQSVLTHQVAGVSSPAGVPPAPPPTTILHHPSGYGSITPNSNNNSSSAAAVALASQMHNNSQHSLTISAAHAAVNQALQEHTETTQNQPVEFNHAINYVNKIKNRFQGQPEKYKRFLEILHTYQKEQRTLKESIGSGSGKHLTEQEVYSQVAKLFENQSDLLAEFGQFLPDATSHTSPPAPLAEHVSNLVKKQPPKQPYRDHMLERHVGHKPGHLSNQIKRSPPYPSIYNRDAPPPKKHKISSCRDVSIAEAGKYGTLNDYAFFDKVRKALRSPEVYNNFLRCLTLFNQEIVSKSELVQLIIPFLGKCPELLKWFREFLGQSETESVSTYNAAAARTPIGGNERTTQSDHLTDAELATAKRLGASYCTNPAAQMVKCSGRTQLCKEVLNDQWVSFPTWSEDSTFVSSRKTQYEEYMYRCEDERFELDVVIETNASTIRVLEGLQKRLNRMSPDEVSRYRLDDCLGGSSPVLHQRALKRIYGDKAQDIIDGLKRSPAVAVPVVLRRLKTKEEEWREAQKGFNKIWREQNEKYYLKSLDHQGINFKQTDVKALRSKSLFNEIELLYDERHEQNEEGAGEPIGGPHLIIPYRDRTILDDAANLLIHHVKRQTGIQKGEKRRIKHILRQFVPDLFFHPRQQFSDDEKEEDEDKEEGGESPKSTSSGDVCKTKIGDSSPGKSPSLRVSEDEKIPEISSPNEEDVKVPLHAQTSDPDEAYTLFMANNNWYIFMRLHATLCERLARIYERAVALAADEVKERKDRKESTAVALRLKPKPQIEIEDYYPAFLDMVKNLLDGNMDASAYEDTLREMFGIHAYTVFTLDKVVQYAVRQLQHCVTERSATACTDLFAKEQKRAATGGPCATVHKRLHLELAYQRAAEALLQEDSCYRMFIYKCDCKLTIELLDSEPDDPKKVEEASKWSSYKERFADCNSTERKHLRSPVYLNRNLRIKTKMKNDVLESCVGDASAVDEEKKEGTAVEKAVNDVDSVRTEAEAEDKSEEDKSEKKSNERLLPERKQTVHPGYDVSDDTQCKFNSADSKILFTVSKDSYLYKHSAFVKARKTHPSVTKRLGARFRSWLKRWTSSNVTDVQQKQCTDWLMGRGEGVVPNRTRVFADNDVSRSPYSSYNRYKVERLTESMS